METRDVVLSLLIVFVGVGIFYLLDPSLAGLLKKHEKHEGFGDNEHVIPESDEHLPGSLAPTMNHVSGPSEAYDNTHSQYAEATPEVHTPSNNGMHMANNNNNNNDQQETVEGFETLSPAPMPFKDADKPANCYPKDQINPQELLPNDPNSKWAQVNPMGQGDIAGKNYLSAGALIGVNTIGQSLRNANYQLRSDPPNPQVKVSIWNQSTIEPDSNRRPLEIA